METYWLPLQRLHCSKKRKNRQRRQISEESASLTAVLNERAVFVHETKAQCGYFCVFLPDPPSPSCICLWELLLYAKQKDKVAAKPFFCLVTFNGDCECRTFLHTDVFFFLHKILIITPPSSTTITALQCLCFPIAGSQPWGLNIMFATWDALQHRGAWHEPFELNNCLSSLPSSSVRIDVFFSFLFFLISPVDVIVYCCYGKKRTI